MRAQITKIKKSVSRITGADVYMVCFKDEDGKARNSWIDSSYRNFKNWNGVLKVGNILSGLTLNGRGNIDADSFPSLVGLPEPTEIIDEAVPREPKQAKLL